MSQNLESALSLLEINCEGAIATIENGIPFASAAGYLYEKKNSGTKYGKIYFLLSSLARHTQNLSKNPAASLLVVEQATTFIHEKKRVSAQGRVARLQNPKKREELKAQYLEVFPRAEIFFTLADFQFYEMEIQELHWIGGFGKAETFKA